MDEPSLTGKRVGGELGFRDRLFLRAGYNDDPWFFNGGFHRGVGLDVPGLGKHLGRLDVTFGRIRAGEAVDAGSVTVSLNTSFIPSDVPMP